MGPGTPNRLAGGFDAPTETEWDRYWTIPVAARLYNALLVVCALAVSLDARSCLTWGRTATLAGLLVAGLANGELGRLAEGGRVERQRIHKGLSAWPLAAALLIGPAAAGITAAVVYTHASVRGIRITRWKWIGSWAIVTLSALAASATMRLAVGTNLPATGSERAMVGVAAALVAFLACETVLLGVISRLNSPEDEVYLRAQLADAGFYLVEASVLASGALVAVLYRYWPGFIVLAGPASFLMQRGMLHEPLRDEARHDPKTGLLHSEAWRSAAEAALAHARRERRHAAVVIVDVDHFKKVNDTYGHLLGDDVLAETASAVVGSVRGTDLVGRFGGDEFCALVICDTAADASAAAERIRTRIGALSFSDPTLSVTASVGVVVVSPVRAGVDLAALIEGADQALYEAKTAGRDRVCARVAGAAGASRPSSPPAPHPQQEALR
ncbi:MAG TPA: GGDEF domain-containing protein [Acidimicrobiales bacterium]|nr:GGDEF domain-containing protein [Acidimicrobiales bacterium]